MKNFIALIILCFSNCYFAQTNSLVVFSDDGNPFQLKIDNHSINKKDEAIVKATELSAGNHLIEIWQFKNGKSSIYKDSITIGKDEKFNNKEFTFVITQEKNNKQALKFKSISELSGPDIPIIPEAPKEKAPLVDNSIYGNLYQAKKNKPVFYNQYNPVTKTCKVILSKSDLEYGKKLVINCNDPELQYRYLTNILENNCYTCAQLNELLTLLSLDIDKLTSSKLAYEHITDKENIALISQSFKYQSMKETFKEYVQNQNIQKNNIKKNCLEAINQSKVDDFVKTIRDKDSEYDKWKLSKEFVSMNCITTKQAKEITQVFLHDREKLDFLKSVYAALVNKSDAAELKTELQSATDQQEFIEYITTHE